MSVALPSKDWVRFAFWTKFKSLDSAVVALTLTSKKPGACSSQAWAVESAMSANVVLPIDAVVAELKRIPARARRAVARRDAGTSATFTSNGMGP